MSALRRTPAIVVQAIVFETGLLIAAWILARVFDLPGPAAIRFTPGGLLWGIVATGPPLLAMASGLRARAGPIARLRAHVEEAILPLFDGCSVWHLALISVLAGLGEEALFRGVAQTGAAALIGIVPAIILAGVLFGVCHPVTPLYSLLAAIVGVYLGALYAATGELLVPVLAHALYDFIALMTLVRARRGGAPAAGPAQDDPTAPAVRETSPGS